MGFQLATGAKTTGTEVQNELKHQNSGKPALNWNARKRIAIGAARGFLYLHEQCDPKIIHRDVKAANVLLDDFCEAVVGDFGLAKLLDHNQSHVTTAESMLSIHCDGCKHKVKKLLQKIEGV
ncbi:hypothetical protein POM88_013153 [Heracleum sosnowskyi]|uniref:non-specific serine/threonine protein kinase n=1 Tax=Heracleum sosnowskyi TaxID=360622 RepID=A0AAD8N341_9APIA|nr:hypothetical protein POM88_013153 [Heracleum sosnowskyi]